MSQPIWRGQEGSIPAGFVVLLDLRRVVEARSGLVFHPSRDRDVRHGTLRDWLEETSEAVVAALSHRRRIWKLSWPDHESSIRVVCLGERAGQCNQYAAKPVAAKIDEQNPRRRAVCRALHVVQLSVDLFVRGLNLRPP
jgi:hypothetical protein